MHIYLLSWSKTVFPISTSVIFSTNHQHNGLKYIGFAEITATYLCHLLATGPLLPIARNWMNTHTNIPTETARRKFLSYDVNPRKSFDTARVENNTLVPYFLAILYLPRGLWIINESAATHWGRYMWHHMKKTKGHKKSIRYFFPTFNFTNDTLWST